MVKSSEKYLNNMGKNKISLYKFFCLVLFLSIFFVIIIKLFPNQRSLGIENEIIKEIDFEFINHQNYDLFTGKGKNTTIRIKRINNLNQTEIIYFINEERKILLSLYKEVPSPYPGRISQTISCDKSFLPKEKLNLPFNYFLLYATNRYTYGACSWDLIEFRSILYYKQCDNSIYVIEMFLPLKEEIKDYESIMLETVCIY